MVIIGNAEVIKTPYLKYMDFFLKNFSEHSEMFQLTEFLSRDIVYIIWCFILMNVSFSITDKFYNKRGENFTEIELNI